MMASQGQNVTGLETMDDVPKMDHESRNQLKLTFNAGEYVL